MASQVPVGRELRVVVVATASRAVGGQCAAEALGAQRRRYSKAYNYLCGCCVAAAMLRGFKIVAPCSDRVMLPQSVSYEASSRRLLETRALSWYSLADAHRS